MQLDMHYYATYALARAAGMQPEAARVVATAAEFVDDNGRRETVLLQDGARLDVEATAHHSADIRNIDLEDQRKIWLPFHFLPGNQGDSYSERLLCRKDSEIAREMVEHNLGAAQEPYALELLGITAHVYADTFSHYGFSGVSSRRNMVAYDSFTFFELTSEMEAYIRSKAQGFFKTYGKENGGLINFKEAKTVASGWERLKEIFLAIFAQRLSGALGHGAVATFPDRPYLNWGFDYEYPARHHERRSNPDTYLEACLQLHAMFGRFLERAPQYRADDGLPFDRINEVVTDILLHQAPLEGRIARWAEAATRGHLFKSGGETIAAYSEQTWQQQLTGFARLSDSRQVTGFNVYRFYQSASIHRNYVLRRLLPSHGLVVQ